jgi:hypothetical protein
MDATDKSFSFAQDAVKQLITLSTAIVTVTVTVSTNFLKTHISGSTTLLVVAWIAFLMSIICGVFALLSMSGTLATSSKPNIYASNIRLFALLQLAAFVAGLGMTIWFGGTAL